MCVSCACGLKMLNMQTIIWQMPLLLLTVVQVLLLLIPFSNSLSTVASSAVKVTLLSTQKHVKEGTSLCMHKP